MCRESLLVNGTIFRAECHMQHENILGNLCQTLEMYEGKTRFVAADLMVMLMEVFV